MLSRREVLKRTAVLAAGAAAGRALGQAPVAETMAPVAATNSGSVRGFVNEGVLVFKGIPYGDDTSKRRFQSPARPLPWVGIRDAVTFGPQAPQEARAVQGGREVFQALDEISPVNSEDCLHLNVWTAGLRDNRKRPVMVYLHGGGGYAASSGYFGSSSNGPTYDGVRLVKRGDVVVVTLNHRLNLFGYLYLAELGGPAFADSGNVGQLDVVLALEWVRDNIGEFGGDSKRVLIFGDGGGGAKCTTLMAMPRAKGLFHRVATMGGQQITALTPARATMTARAVLAALGVTRAGLSDLRDPKKFPMEKLVAVLATLETGQSFGPVRDGRTLPRDPFTPDAPVLSANIPMMLGSAHDASRTLLGRGDASLFSLSWEELPERLGAYRQIAGANLDNVVALYRSWYPAYSASDVFFAVTTVFRGWHGTVIASDRRAVRMGPTWVYEFDWKSPVDGGKWGAGQTMDLPFVFDTVELAAAMTGGGVRAELLADQVSGSLIAFAVNGDPNNAAIPKWPRYDLARRATMCWDVETTVKNDPRGQERKLVETVPYVQPGT